MKNYYVAENKRNNGLNFWDDAFESLFNSRFYNERKDMKTDVKETENSYLMDIEVPGFDKSDIKITLDDGYLTVSAERHEEENHKEDKKNHGFIRKERSCSVSRSFYVGDVKEEDVKAKFENGLLSLEIAKKEPQVESHNILIQ
jgi:HSP20 family molecular chaperone IbpA